MLAVVALSYEEEAEITNEVCDPFHIFTYIHICEAEFRNTNPKY